MNTIQPPRSRSLRARTALAGLLFASIPALAQQVNAPVAPDTIYVARFGAVPGLSVIDLNGFGASTGNPAYDPTYTMIAEGDSNYPNNPNLKFQGSLMRPPLVPGTNTLNGGSAGVFTLTKDSSLADLLVRAPSIGSVGDMMLGQPLDILYNNGPAPFGCQAGGGNLCAFLGLKTIEAALTGLTLQPALLGGTLLNTITGSGNTISWAPHPNPPPLILPPLCLSPLIGGQEPSSIDMFFPLTAIPPIVNLLVPGDPFGQPNLGIPPTGLLSTAQNAFFVGPSAQQPVIAACQRYMIRQQIGHFLYMIDRAHGEVVVLNSNTFTVLAHIPQVDPTELAMSPDLKKLAVTNRSANQVSFIDITPSSPSFHQVVHTTAVENAPSGIAWDPGNEDVLVCNEASDSVSILSASTLNVRKVVKRGLHAPFAVAITPRQEGFGFQRDVYFAYILDRTGKVTLFESGPDGPGGWGYDAIIGQLPGTFANPKAIQPDHARLTSGVWIVHEGQLDANGHPTGLAGGAVSNLVIDAAIPGPIPLGPEPPHVRDMTFAVVRSIGSDQLTGIPTDLAFDDQKNLGALVDFTTPFSAGPAAAINGKNLVRNVGLRIRSTNSPAYMFLAIRTPAPGSPGGVDVIRLSNGQRVDTNAFRPGVQSIPARGATIVMDYFRE